MKCFRMIPVLHDGKNLEIEVASRIFSIESIFSENDPGSAGSRSTRTLVLALVVLACALPCPLLAQTPNDVPLAAEAQSEPEGWDYVLPFGIAMFQNFVFWGFGRLVLQSDYSAVDLNTIERNFTVGFEWDVDAFPTNQLGHPYQGGLYFAGARASNLGYWTSTLYTFVGALQWEMFMENELPSYNDMVTTTFGGIAAGEVLFRLSSALLDESTAGWERVGRELAATVIAPTAGLSRLVTGKIVENGPRPVKPNLRADVIIGPDRLREDDSKLQFSSLNLGIDVQYGDLRPKPDFEPFDWFRITASVNLNKKSVQRGAIDVLALIARHNFECGSGKCLVGMNQHYSFLDTPIFKVGTSSFGGTLGGRLGLGDHLDLTAGLHLNLIALGGVNSLYPAAVQEVYDLGTGAMSRTFLTLDYLTRNKYWFRDIELNVSNTRYFLRTLRGVAGNEYAGVSRFHLHFSVYDGFGVILGTDFYDRQTLPDELPNISSSYYTEQLFLVWKI
jgi:hypothetical protein